MMSASVLPGVVAEGEFSQLLGGLPTHPLIVHGAVVLLPLGALAFLAILLVPRWRSTFGWLAMAAVVLGSGAAVAAKQSGEEFAQQVGLPVEHARFGNLLGPVAALFLVVAVVWFWSQRRGERSSGVVTLSLAATGAVLAVACIVLTVLAGHSGAKAVWTKRLAATSSAAAESQAPAPMPVSPPSAATTGISMSDVQSHAVADDCWTVVGGVVYDLTEWISQHPGGSGVIEGMCGLDATDAFAGQHEGQGGPADALAGFELGRLSAAPGSVQWSEPVFVQAGLATSRGSKKFTMAEVRQHRTPKDCWSAVNGRVYDLTRWIARHPGGSSRIIAMCGKNATKAFNGMHGGSGRVASILKGYRIGSVQ